MTGRIHTGAPEQRGQHVGRGGSDAVYAPLSAELDGDRAVVGRMVERGIDDVAWCQQHWPWPVQGDIFARFA